MRRLLFVLLVALASLLPRDGHAHAMRTAYLEIVEHAPGAATVLFKLPVASRDAWPRFEGCVLRSLDEGTETFVFRLALRCPRTLAGTPLVVEGLGPTVSDAVVRVLLANGTAASQVLTPRTPRWTLPDAQRVTETLVRFAVLGVEHILLGWDHLLFVLGLVLLARDRRRLVWTASAFTLAHSVTLSATALGLPILDRVAPAWAEACIALSLVLVALDAKPTTAENEKNEEETHPAWLASVFGLVHGLGFAGALAEIGLPRAARVSALLAFNVGVELGQLLFIASLLAVAHVARRWPTWRPRARIAAAYAIGGAGSFALLSRASDLLAP